MSPRHPKPRKQIPTKHRIKKIGREGMNWDERVVPSGTNWGASSRV
jgi:hypothetical protein